MDLKTEQKRYRVRLEESYENETEEGKTFEKWRYYEIFGRRGIIYPFSRDLLAVNLTSMVIAKKAEREMPKDWRILQNGEDEVVFTLPNRDLDKAASLISAYKKRQVTEEMREKGRLLAEKFSKPKK